MGTIKTLNEMKTFSILQLRPLEDWSPQNVRRFQRPLMPKAATSTHYGVASLAHLLHPLTHLSPTPSFFLLLHHTHISRFLPDSIRYEPRSIYAVAAGGVFSLLALVYLLPYPPSTPDHGPERALPCN
jgi:hypothetical protein